MARGWVDGSEALAEACGAEAGDGFGWVAVTPRNTGASRLGLGMRSHGCTKRVMANGCIMLMLMLAMV